MKRVVKFRRGTTDEEYTVFVDRPENTPAQQFAEFAFERFTEEVVDQVLTASDLFASDWYAEFSTQGEFKRFRISAGISLEEAPFEGRDGS